MKLLLEGRHALKKIAIRLIAAVACWPAIAAAEPRTYALDPEHTIVAFLVDHVGFSRMLGRFKEVQGGFTYDEVTKTLSDLEVTVKTASVETDHEQRDKHVRSPDFLNVQAYPEMVFTASGGTPAGDDTGTVEGELMLLGETRPLSLSVTLNKSAVYPFGHASYTLGLSARGSLMRSDYGMTYGVANGLVGNRVDIIIETEAVEAKR